MSEGERRLAAIMFTDIVGYTALTQESESATVALLETHRRLVRPIFAGHRGREIKTIGDAFLVEFQSALDAVLCAVAVQQTMHDRKLATGDAPSLRIGVHIGDVIEKGNDILGDAVNIASRIEPLAEPGGICISDEVYRQVRNKSDLPFVSLGERSLKNVSTPLRVYKARMPWEQSATAETPAYAPNRIAILPFTSFSPDPNDAFFADGVTDEIISAVAGISGLSVISRTSVIGYKGTTKKVKEIGRELEVGSILEGTFKKAGNRIRVTTQLIDVSQDRHLWAQNYDRNLDDVFEVQSDVAKQVAEALRVKILAPEKERIEKRPTDSTEAYSAFLRGMELFREAYEAPVRQALALFEKATEMDPSFARAYVGVAECHQWLAGGYEPWNVMLPPVKASLKRALELDPDLPEAHTSLSMLLFNEDDLPTAESEARRAIELNPSLPDPYFMLSEILMTKGEFDEAVRMTEAAYRLDPIRPRHIYALGYLYLYAGREQEALEHMRKTENLHPGGTYRNMTDYYLTKGDITKAREMHAKFVKLQPTHPWVTYMGGFIDAMAGEREKALAAIKKIEEANVGPVGYNYVAWVYCALGDMDGYFEYLNKANDAHTMMPIEIMYSPLLAKAREDPRYAALVQKLRKQCGLAA